MSTGDRLAEPPARVGFIGKTLGRFLINAELGRGGMATVYRAHDPQLGRDVAVKVMHGFFAGRPEIEARFKREATAVAAIKHPSILALYDFASPAGEEPGYIVSELVEGPGLRQVVEGRGGRLLPEIAVLITIRVAEALGAAHAAGIVHRDVKPDNVLIDRAGGGARVVLTDFGVAHVSGLDTMTAIGAVLGSPAYMSPEQARGEDVGPQSDVFSLGVLLYQLCTGHLPFSGKDPLTLIAALLRGDYLSPTKVEARVGPDLERVIARCLARDPVARFSDGVAVATTLREWLATARLGGEEAALRAALGEPEAFERELSPRIAGIALASAETARRRGHMPRALAEVGRALAYAPEDPAALALLGRLGSHRRTRWIHLGLAITGATMIIGGGWFWAQRVRSPEGRDVSKPTSTVSSAVATSRAAVGSTSNATPVPGPEHPNVAASLAPPVPTTASRRLYHANRDGPPRSAAEASTGPKPRRRNTVAGAIGATGATGATGTTNVTRTTDLNSTTNAKAPSPSPVGPPSGQIPAAGLDRPALPTTAPPRPTETATASVVLRASHGFCEPSLDALPPSLRANYTDLAPGQHEIFCTLPQGGPKVHVASYDLKPGTRASLIVVPGPGGKPELGRPE